LSFEGSENNICIFIKLGSRQKGMRRGFILLSNLSQQNVPRKTKFIVTITINKK